MQGSPKTTTPLNETVNKPTIHVKNKKRTLSDCGIFFFKYLTFQEKGFVVLNAGCPWTTTLSEPIGTAESSLNWK
jgi:hypothetical protein